MSIQTQQIIYKLENYANSGQIETTQIETNGNKHDIDIYQDVFYQIFGNDFNRDISIIQLGIQAPPGTRFNMKTNSNDNFREFRIGRTGIYEIAEEDIKVVGLSFIRPKRYKYNSEKSTESIINGINQMYLAKQNFDKAIAGLFLLNADYSASETDWMIYNQAHKEYVDQYQSGRESYIEGINGIYDEDTISSDLKNIIIDFIYVKGQGAE